MRTADDAGQLRAGAHVVHDGRAREGAGGGVAVECGAHQVGDAQALQLLRGAARNPAPVCQVISSRTSEGQRLAAQMARPSLLST